MSKETEKVVDLIINDEKAEALSAINDLIKEKISEDETFKKLEDEMSKYLQVNESIVEARLTIKGYRVDVIYQPPRGYYVIGKSPEIKNQISKTYFNTFDEAEEHAYLEIEGYLEDNK